MDRHAHWQQVYENKGEREVSWFQEMPSISLKLIQSSGLTLDTCVLDIGGGDSRLVDALLAKGVGCVCVLDIDGPITLGDFGQPHQDGACDHEGQCVLIAVWNEAGEYMRHHLDSYTLAMIADIARGGAPWPVTASAAVAASAPVAPAAAATP